MIRSCPRRLSLHVDLSSSLWWAWGVGGPSLDQQAHPCHGLQVYKGYMDDPRNTDNAWIETVAVSIHFRDQNDSELRRLEEVGAPASRAGKMVNLRRPKGVGERPENSSEERVCTWVV